MTSDQKNAGKPCRSFQMSRRSDRRRRRKKPRLKVRQARRYKLWVCQTDATNYNLPEFVIIQQESQHADERYRYASVTSDRLIFLQLTGFHRNKTAAGDGNQLWRCIDLIRIAILREIVRLNHETANEEQGNGPLLLGSRNRAAHITSEILEGFF